MRAVLWVAVSTKAQAEDEKESLPAQEASARALCTQNSWTIIETLTVPGHSRRYIDIHECARDMLRQGINAFARLLELWEDRGFDVLVVRDGSRFARTQTLHAYVTERTIELGARIYSMTDGWIDEHNYRMWIAMSGYASAGEVDRLVRSRRAAMDRRAERGLPTTSRVLMSHMLITDEASRAQRVVVDESKRRLWDDLATLLLEGVGWHRIEIELTERFGHAPIPGGTMYRVIHSPTFWGHSARHFRNIRGPNKHRTDMWVLGPGNPVPEGVLVFYNTHEPVYTGELAERVKAELRRRRATVRGKARPYRTYKFTGLLSCGECGYNLVLSRKDHYTGMYCPTPHVGRYESRDPCTQHRHIPEWKIVEWLDARLQQAMQAGGMALFQGPEGMDNEHTRGELLEKETAELELQIRRLILKQATTPDGLRGLYDAEIEAAYERLRTMRGELLSTKQRLAEPESAASQHRALDELIALSLERFWGLPDTAINQLLHRLLGGKKLVVLQGEIVGVTS